MKKVAIIPARSGSKGLKDKNIIDVAGMPLMAYTITAARNSGVFSRIIVSTDSHQYGQISEQYGAEAVYRGEKLSDDNATTFMVVEDLLARMEESYDYFVLLQPTSPMRNEAHIREAVSLFESRYDDFDFLVSMKEAEHAQVLVKPIDEDGSLRYFDTDFSNYRRQGYKDYSPNGAIFIGKCDAYLKQKHFFGKKSMAYMMSKMDSIDIDDELDYRFACFCMEKGWIRDGGQRHE